MTEQHEHIETLSDDRALEAVQLLAGEQLGVVSDADLRDTVASSLARSSAQVDQAVNAATPAEVANLARLVLSAYVDAGYASEVKQAIDDTGQQALLLEIAVLGALGLGLLHTINTRGRKETVSESTVTSTPDGQVTVSTTETVRYYSVGQSLAPLVGKLVSLGRGDGGG